MVNMPFLRRKCAASADAPIKIAPIVQPEEMDEEYRQMLRSAVQMEVQTILAMRDRVITEIATSLRWVQASLLLVNSGAAVAVLQSDALSAATRAWSGALFVLGIILSLFTATAGVAVAKDAPKKLTNFAGYWIGVGIDLLRDETTEREWQDYAMELDRRSRLPRALGYGSAASFIIGCLIVGLAIV